MQPYTIGDVLREAWRSFRRTGRAHAAWNVGFVLVLGLGLMIVICPVAVLTGAAERSGAGLGPAAGLALAYLAGAVAMLFAWALHQGTTLAITAADLRGDRVEVGV